jgi:3-oxoacyl-[acyl-carrier protein] reductase
LPEKGWTRRVKRNKCEADVAGECPATLRQALFDGPELVRAPAICGIARLRPLDAPLGTNKEAPVLDLHDRVALITGASGGLGAVIARLLADHGVHVAVTHLGHRDEAVELCRQIEAKGRKTVLVHLDQTDPASCSAAVEQTVKTLGRLDILINNAAWNDPVPLPDLESLTPEIWDRGMNTNLRGPFLMTRAAAGHLKRQGQGRVINISGVPGLVPAGSIALAVSKAGLIHLTRCLAVALAPSITVNCIAPGLIEGTRMFARVPAVRVAAAKEQAALKRATNAEDVARQVVLFCQSDSVTGQTLVIDAGLVFH